MTPLRRLQGITYWVIDDEDGIRDFINTNVRKEWEADVRSVGRNPSEDPWLHALSGRRWRLQTLDTSNIGLDPDLMNHVDPEKGYSFRDSLAKRGKELRSVMETYGMVIWPIVVREEEMLLVDGYCRLTTLREMGITQVFAYLGTL